MVKRQVHNIKLLLRTGKATVDQLWDAADNYAEHCDIMATPAEYRYACSNFYGQAMRWLDYEPGSYVKPEKPQDTRGTGFEKVTPQVSYDKKGGWR